MKNGDRPIYLYARQYRDFTDDATYEVRLCELLADIRSDATATLPDTYRKTRVTYVTVPPRVANYLERPKALDALRDALFAEDHRHPITLIAVAGMGGIGKTVLAKALTDDEVVQRAFPDGIVWITAGKGRKREFIEEMREVAKALGDDLSQYDNALGCENQYRTTIANKAALIVVDDVWSKADIEPLLAESPRSRFLFTTRDAAIGKFVSAREHHPDLLDFEQSRKLLASWANVPIADLPAAADDVIAECGRLPLAVSVIGAMLRGMDAVFWTDTLDLLRKADLAAIQEQLPEGQQSFFKAVEVSFQSLKPEMQERYKALAELPEDIAASLPILQTLWNANEAETRRISKRLVEMSLAQSDQAGESIFLHDLQLDYVRAQYGNRKALELIHGAARLSSHVLARDPGQYASQMVGRLLSDHAIPGIDQFIVRVRQGAPRPWLCPLYPALVSPGSAFVHTLEGHTGVISGLAIIADGKSAISCSWDRSVRVWDLESGRELHRMRGDSFFDSISVSADGRRAATYDDGKRLRLWNLESLVQFRQWSSEQVHSMSFSADGRRFAYSTDYKITIVHLDDSQESRVLRINERVSKMSADGRRAVSYFDESYQHTDALRHGGTASKPMKVWDLQGGRELCQIEGHDGPVGRVALSADGCWAVSNSRNQLPKVWDLDSGRQKCTLGDGDYPGYNLALSVDGRWALSVSEKTVKVWDLQLGKEVRVLRDHPERVGLVALSPDGRTVISACGSSLKVWDLQLTQRQETGSWHTIA